MAHSNATQRYTEFKCSDCGEEAEAYSVTELAIGDEFHVHDWQAVEVH